MDKKEKVRKRELVGATDQEISDRELLGKRIARRAAAESMVLLKNEGSLLPLEKGARVALYGAGAVHTVKGGMGSGDVNVRETVSIWRGIADAGFEITNIDWLENFSFEYEKAKEAWKEEINAACANGENFFEAYTSRPFKTPAGAMVREQDIDKEDRELALYVISRTAGEGRDRREEEGDYYLTAEERGFLNQITDIYEKVIVVLNTGAQIDLSFMDDLDNIHGLFYIGQPGMEAGHAFADILSGEVTPSGKLTNTWAMQYGDYPNAENFSHLNGDLDQEIYSEGIYVGYRYFDSYEIPVRFCFGYGLSYTEFSSEITSVTKDEQQNIHVEITVKNIGDTRGREIVQLYASSPIGKIEKEFRRLVGYGKTRELMAGEEEHLELVIDLKQLASYDETRSGWALEKGTYGLWIGSCLDDADVAALLELDEDAVLTSNAHICEPESEIALFSRETVDMMEQNHRWMAVADRRENLPHIKLAADEISAIGYSYETNTAYVESESKAIVDTLTDEQVRKLTYGRFFSRSEDEEVVELGSAGISLPGSAGETTECAEEQGLASVILADGPAGLRLNYFYVEREGRPVIMPFEFSVENGYFYPQAENEEGERHYLYCTAFPVGATLAQSWDDAMISEVGQMVAEEMKEFGVTLWLAPGMNIHRNPLCGRNFEYYSEDPLVSGYCAAAMTEGVQSVSGCGTTIKHFAANNQEDNRMHVNAVVSERALREIYLRGFEIAITKAQPMSIMTSYNKINGVHSANNADLCTKFARAECGFKGVIMTDWTTTLQNEECTAAGCIRAGNDLIMPGAPLDEENIRTEVENGTLSMDDVKACAARVAAMVRKSDRYESI